MCSQHTDDPKNSPFSESMNVPFIVRFPDKIKPRLDDLMLSSPDIMPTLLGLAGLSDSIPTDVQGRNYAPLFFNEKADISRTSIKEEANNIRNAMEDVGKKSNLSGSDRKGE